MPNMELMQIYIGVATTLIALAIGAVSNGVCRKLLYPLLRWLGRAMLWRWQRIWREIIISRRLSNVSDFGSYGGNPESALGSGARSALELLTIWQPVYARHPNWVGTHVEDERGIQSNEWNRWPWRWWTYFVLFWRMAKPNDFRRQLHINLRSFQ